MNIKFYKTVIAAVCMLAMLMVGCTSQDVDVTPQETIENAQNLKVRLNANVTQFTGEDATRAGEEWTWSAGSVLFVQFYNGTNVVRGHLTYMNVDGEYVWEPSFAGSLGSNDKCEIYYFDGVEVSDYHNVMLNVTNAVYADKSAMYSVSGGVLSISTTLAPLTGRIRFKGQNDLGIFVSGLTYYTSYDADANELKNTDAVTFATVRSTGYTPYIYAVFTDQASPRLNISNSQDADVQFVKDFSASVLRIGESGYMTIPTEATNKGWNTVVAVKSVTLSQSAIALDKGETTDLVATVTPSSATDRSVIWTTSDASVATVAGGKVTAVNYGTCTITASSVQDSGKKAECKVFVSKEKIFTVGGVAFTMKLIEAGTFQMGSANDGDNDERPVHSVTISKNYYMGETEVTQALWKAVTGYSPTNGGSSWSSSYGIGDDYPAYYISYEDVQSFISKLNSMTGQQFRMPTEAEWEYAAKGGNKSKGYNYSGSNTIGDVAWYTDNSGSKTHEVKTKVANELGLYDMSGNVWEWCADWYSSSYYTNTAVTDPTGPTTGSNRVYRGGSWSSSATFCRSAYRSNNSPSYRSNGVGFRLAL